MGTSYEKIFDSFLAKVNDDDWSNSEEIDYHIEDWKALLHSALALFKFPRFNTICDDDNECMLSADLTQEEIEIIANLMKEEWLDRTIHTWDQVKTMYDERDFSQANMLAQLIKAHDAVAKKNYHLQKMYSRSIMDEDGNKAVFDYRIFGGRNGS